MPDRPQIAARTRRLGLDCRDGRRVPRLPRGPRTLADARRRQPARHRLARAGRPALAIAATGVFTCGRATDPRRPPPARTRRRGAPPGRRRARRAGPLPRPRRPVELDGLGLGGRLAAACSLPRPASSAFGAARRSVRCAVASTTGRRRAVDGVPVTTPLRTAFDLARPPTLEDVVIAVDVLARGRPAFSATSPTTCASTGAARGTDRVVRAVRLWQSLGPGRPASPALALSGTWRRGLPRPEVNAIVVTTDGLGMG